ncbi:Uncharacterised protein [Mycobacteroides abscessus subsp. abscessus]|nr:Uncharacterised protein [Mycobacteroides abscessus subsp. abscessus]
MRPRPAGRRVRRTRRPRREPGGMLHAVAFRCARPKPRIGSVRGSTRPVSQASPHASPDRRSTRLPRAPKPVSSTGIRWALPAPPARADPRWRFPPWQPELATDGRSWGRRFRRHARRRGWWCVDTRRRPAFGAPSRAPRHPCPGRGGVRPGVCPLSGHPASFDINNNDTSGMREGEGPTDTWREPACAARRSRSPWRP